MQFLLALLSPSLCVACGGDARWNPPLCRECRAALTPLSGGAGLFAYDGPAGALVRALKFDARAGIADVMAAHLVANTPPEWLGGSVVPVPVHPEHRRRRGIDHAAELGRALAARASLPFHPCLERVGDPLPQVGRGRRERMRGPVGAVRVRKGVEIPRAALLVDDVVTTGATLAACVRALTQGGCGEIAAIAFARTTAR